DEHRDDEDGQEGEDHPPDRGGVGLAGHREDLADLRHTTRLLGVLGLLGAAAEEALLRRLAAVGGAGGHRDQDTWCRGCFWSTPRPVSRRCAGRCSARPGGRRRGPWTPATRPPGAPARRP